MDTSEAVLVHAQNVRDYFVEHHKEHDWDQLDKFTCVKPAFSRMMLSYDHAFNATYDHNYQIHKLATPLVRHCQIRIMELGMEQFRYHYLEDAPHDPEYADQLPELIQFIAAVQPSSVLQIGIAFDGRQLPGRWFVFLDATGKVLVYPPFGWVYVNTIPEMKTIREKHIPIDDLQNTFCKHGCIALAALTFMNCKNVEVVDNRPSRQMRRQAERNGQPKPPTYKTLVIHPFHKIRKSAQAPGGGLLPGVSLHICRGHFKDFREGPGLGRGHAHGLWWWSPQVRGTPELGRVVKDYSVVTSD